MSDVAGYGCPFRSKFHITEISRRIIWLRAEVLIHLSANNSSSVVYIVHCAPKVQHLRPRRNAEEAACIYRHTRMAISFLFKFFEFKIFWSRDLQSEYEL